MKAYKIKDSKKQELTHIYFTVENNQLSLVLINIYEQWCQVYIYSGAGERRKQSEFKLDTPDGLSKLEYKIGSGYKPVPVAKTIKNCELKEFIPYPTIDNSKIYTLIINPKINLIRSNPPVKYKNQIEQKE